MHTLYCLLLGQSYRQVFVCQMIDHIHARQGRESLFMLPSSQLLAQVRQEVLAKDPTCLPELNLLSFDDLVTQVLENSGVKRTFMSRMTQELLVKKVVDELTAQGCLPYFCEMSHFPGYIRTITSFLGEVKRTGTTAEEWQSVLAAKASEDDDAVVLEGFSEAELARQKDQETALIYLRYQEELAALQLVDLEERYFLAIEALRLNPQLLPYRFIYLSEFYILTPLQLALVDIIRQDREFAIALVYENNRQEVYSAVEETYTALIGQGFVAKFVPAAMSRGSHCLDYLVDNIFTERAVNKQLASCISLVQAPHRMKELAAFGAALKEKLISEKMQPQAVAIIVRDVAAYSELRPLFAELKIPLDLLWEEPLERQPLTQLIFDYIATRLENGSKSVVQKLLKSPFVAASYLCDSDKIVADSSSWRIQGWTEWLNFGQQDNSVLAILQQLQKQVESIPRQGTAATINQALSVIIESLDVLAYLGLKYRQNKLPLVRLKAAYLTYQALDRTRLELEEELAALGQANRELTLPEYRQLFTQLLSAEVLKIATGDPSGVKVISPAGARGISFDFVAILGLTEGEFPQQIRENWLYDDKERKLLNDLGVPLATAAKRRLEEKFYFAVSLSIAKQGLYLSGIGTSETLLSPFFAEVERIVDILPEQRVRFTVDEVLAQNYEAIYTERDYQQKAIYDMCQGAVANEAQQLGRKIFPHFEIPDFWRKVAAATSRREASNSLYSGYAANWQQVSGTAVTDEHTLWSISRLEDYLQCPFAYFLKHILRLTGDEEAEETTEASMTGQLYHQVLVTFLSRYRGQSLQPEHAAHYEILLLQDFAKIVDEWIVAGKFHPGKFWFYEQQQMTKIFTNWLHYELERQAQMTVPLRPTYFEWGFGLPVTENLDRASVATPFTLTIDDRKVLFCGKVDRIDTTELNYAVYDYKKSGSPAVNETLELGTDLQIPLYIAAVQQLLVDQQGGTVKGGSYYSLEKCAVQGGMWYEEYQNCLGPTKLTKKSFLSYDEWTEFYQAFGQRILAAVDGIACGSFPLEPAKGCSDYCIGQKICRKEGEV
jgi:ATP-dependent helicase/nuclease subunit B